MGGRAAGWALWVDPQHRPVLTFRVFEVDRVSLVGEPLEPGRHQVEVVFDYQGPGWARPAQLTVVCDGRPVAKGHLRATPPAIFSIDETFDIGCTTGSPVGDFPVSFPFSGGTIERVDLELDG
jgi:arylsulfatase